MRTHTLRGRLATLTLALIVPLSSNASLRQCPSSGAAALEVVLGAADSTATTDALVYGTLDTASCTSSEPALATEYAVAVTCQASVPSSCRAHVTGLQPGRWVHRLAVLDENRVTQRQARPDLLLDQSAGTSVVEWPLYAAVVTVASTEDGDGCVGCLRDALTRVSTAPKPALVQFAPDLVGTVVLRAALPVLDTGAVTIDGYDFNGRPLQRAIDANGLGTAALVIRSADNAVAGLRLANAGRNSDVVLVEGVGADNNLLESLQVAGRAQEVCGTRAEGCLIDGVCRTPQTDPVFGACGDDGIAVRSQAGMTRPNLVRQCEVFGAFDKGIKVSEQGVARVEGSFIHDNRDGGLQATTSGRLTAIENWVDGNRGTISANGIAANGSAALPVPIPAELVTIGNIIRKNSLRGISVRGLSQVDLFADYACGNSPLARAFGLAILDASALSADVRVGGLASVYNGGGGASVSGIVAADLGGLRSLGDNAFAFNGTAAAPRNLQNLSAAELPARNNQWQHCGRGWVCDATEIADRDVDQRKGAGPVAILPTQPHYHRTRSVVTRVVPPIAAAGDIVRVYGSGFDAVDGNGPGLTCDTISTANSCRPLRGNCVLIDREPAEILAVTPTMLLVRVPETCVTPVTLAVRTRHARGFGRIPFCVLPDAPDEEDTEPLLARTGLTRAAAGALAVASQNR